MARQKLKNSEKVAALRTYVKRKYHPRIQAMIKNEVEKIQLEELLQKHQPIEK